MTDTTHEQTVGRLRAVPYVHVRTTGEKGRLQAVGRVYIELGNIETPHKEDLAGVPMQRGTFYDSEDLDTDDPVEAAVDRVFQLMEVDDTSPVGELRSLLRYYESRCQQEGAESLGAFVAAKSVADWLLAAERGQVTYDGRVTS